MKPLLNRGGVLLSIVKPVTANSDKIGLGAAWLFTTATTLIERHIWSPAEAIWFLLLAQNIALALELFYLHRQGKLNWKLARIRLIRVITGFFGTVLTLFISTGIARYSTIFQNIYLPQAVIALVFSVVLTNTAKQASRLGIISPMIAQFLENQSKYVQKQLEKNEPVSPVDSLEPQVVEPTPLRDLEPDASDAGTHPAN